MELRFRQVKIIQTLFCMRLLRAKDSIRLSKYGIIQEGLIVYLLPIHQVGLIEIGLTVVSVAKQPQKKRIRILLRLSKEQLALLNGQESI